MIKYIGSKRLLIPVILDLFNALRPDGNGTVLDLFSGTSRVGHAAKRMGYQVFANDHNAYATALARAYVEADETPDLFDTMRKLVAEFNALPGAPGYVTETFCERSRFFHPDNGARIDAIREAIVQKDLDPELEAVMLVSLMEAADRVDSTCGLQMAYLKQWAPRAHNPIELRLLDLLPIAKSGKGLGFQLEARDAVRSLKANIAYLDPPYNQHKYLGNYHIWESLVRWDKPLVYGIACKRIDCKERTSAFNSRPGAPDAFLDVIRRVQAEHLVVSFSNEGYFTRDQVERMLSERGEVVTINHDFKRYVGAQIGIHNLKGEKVGEVSHLRNVEYVFVVSRDEAALDRVRALTTRAP